MATLEHVSILKHVPFYTMPFDYVELMTGRATRIMHYAKVNRSSIMHGNYFSDLASRRLNQVSNGLLVMMEIERSVEAYTEKELKRLCQKKAAYRNAYNQAKP